MYRLEISNLTSHEDKINKNSLETGTLKGTQDPPPQKKSNSILENLRNIAPNKSPAHGLSLNGNTV